jgi:hypothetical protein
MTRAEQILSASVGMFTGSLLAEVFFGDGIQTDDVYQALMVALIAGVLQAWMTRGRS